MALTARAGVETGSPLRSPNALTNLLEIAVFDMAGTRHHPYTPLFYVCPSDGMCYMYRSSKRIAFG